jgi:hypothetical protein
MHISALFGLLTCRILFSCDDSSDQRERARVNRAAARIGWRPCRLMQMAALCGLLSLSTASGQQLGNGAMELSFDAHTGLWTELKCNGQLLAGAAEQPGFDVKQDGVWLADKRSPQPRDVQFHAADKHTLVVACTIDQWRV